jgi:outer membrane protein assembly factor BamB
MIQNDYRTKTITFLILFFLLNVATAFSAENWTGWRGVEKQAISATSKGPVEWSDTQNIVWSTAIDGEGHSSPIVSNNFVITTSARHQSGNNPINSGLVILILVIIIGITTISWVSIGKQFKNGGYPNHQWVGVLAHIFLLGLFLFLFICVSWMFFNEKRFDSDRQFSAWFFSGSFFFLTFLLLLRHIRFQRLTGILLVFGLFGIIAFILFNRPHTEYYSISYIFHSTSITNAGAMAIGFLVPVIASLLLLIKQIVKKETYVLIDKSIEPTKLINAAKKQLYPVIIAFFLGVTGFLLAPLLFIVKNVYRNYTTGAPVSSDIFSIPDFTFPYFLWIIITGYLIWFVLEYKRVDCKIVFPTWYMPIICVLACAIFGLMNFGLKAPGFVRLISCYDRYTGNLLWNCEGLIGPAVNVSNYNSQATPTPVIHNGHVVAYFGNAGVMCCDTTGNLLWINQNLPFDDVHGASSSLIVANNSIIVTSANSQAPYMCALDLSSGNLLWKNSFPPRNGSSGEYRTPMAITLNGKEVIFEWCSFNRELRFYKPIDGELLHAFKIPWRTTGEAIISPIFRGDTLILFNRSNAHAVSVKSILEKKAPIIWETDLKGKGPDTPTPVYSEGKLFVISDNGFATCLNGSDGKILWQKKLKGIYYSSNIAVGDKVYFTNSSGITTVIKAENSFTQISENEIPEEMYATPVPVDEQLFIRTTKNLWCIQDN